MHTVTINSKVIEVTHIQEQEKGCIHETCSCRDSLLTELKKQVSTVCSSKLFNDWAETIDPRFYVHGIAIQSCDFKDPEKRKPLFIKLVVTLLTSEKEYQEQIVVLRGGSVGILVIRVCEGKEHVILVKQKRIATGQYEAVSIPAGMLDGSTNSLVVGAKEIGEETGIVKIGKLVNMTDYIYGQNHPGVSTSDGLLNERVELLLSEEKITTSELEEMQGRIAGLKEEGEETEVVVVPIDEAMRLAPDAKTIAALYLYRRIEIDRINSQLNTHSNQ